MAENPETMFKEEALAKESNTKAHDKGTSLYWLTAKSHRIFKKKQKNIKQPSFSQPVGLNCRNGLR